MCPSILTQFLLIVFRDQLHQDDASDSDSGKEGDTNIHTDAEAVRCIQKSGSDKLFMELLSTCYMPMEVWYLRSVVEKVPFHPYLRPYPPTMH